MDTNHFESKVEGGFGVSPESSRFTDCNSMQQNLTGKPNSSEEFLLYHDSFLLSPKTRPWYEHKRRQHHKLPVQSAFVTCFGSADR